MDDSEDSQQFFSRVLEESQHVTTAYLAAMSVIDRAREQTPAAMVDAVLNYIRRFAGRRRTQYELQGALLALLPIGPERSYPLFLQILPLLQDPEQSEKMAALLIDLAFNHGQVQNRSYSWSRDQYERPEYRYSIPPGLKPLDPAELSAQQREVLAALLAHDPLWQLSSNLFELYGLPDGDRSRLRT
jgi:hypothetical protein